MRTCSATRGDWRAFGKFLAGAKKAPESRVGRQFAMLMLALANGISHPTKRGITMTLVKAAGRKSSRVNKATTQPATGPSPFREGVLGVGKESAGRAIATALVLLLAHFPPSVPEKCSGTPAHLELQLPA
jgi:hypothetical protein